jgi:abhydrolase domain-containing protein 6
MNATGTFIGRTTLKNLTLKILGVMIATLFMSFVYIWNFRPDLALAGLYTFYTKRAGLHYEEIQTPDQKIGIYTGSESDRTPVLMIHGFGDSKVSFGQAARHLSNSRRLILPDVPGFGDSLQDPNQNHGISSQVTAIKSMLDSMSVKRIALVGNSMGGHISAAFTLTFPEMVERLVLIDAAGLKVDDPSPYADSASPMTSDEDFDAYMKKVFFKTPWIPKPFKANFIARSHASFDWLNRIRSEIRGDKDYILNDRIEAITIPTLILWGRHDEIVSPAHAAVWHEKIKGSKLVIWDDAGHSPQYEYPDRTGELLSEFIN